MSLSGDIGVLTTDAAMVVLSWDEWLAVATSIPRERAVGRELAALVPAFDERDLRGRFTETISSGAVQIFSSALHGPLFPCAPRFRSRHFALMQQRVTIGPLLDGDRIVGLMITVQDVTAQLETERNIAAALTSGDPDIRRSAADAIASNAQFESIESFSAALGSDDWRVRRAAVDALAVAANHDLLRSVLSALQREHRNFSALSGALKLLAVTDVDITAPLTDLLRNPDADLRIQAALALGEQHHPAAIPPLIAALEDADTNVRFHAIEALGRRRAFAAVEPLVAIVESRDFFTGFAALDALAAIGDSRVAPRLAALLADPAFRDPAADALGRLGDERVIPPLGRALNQSQDAAMASAAALSAIVQRLAGEGLDLSPVVRESVSEAGRRHLLAAADDAPPHLRPAVARVLGWVGGEAAVGPLRSLIVDPGARSDVVEAFTQLGALALDDVVEMLADDDADVRSAAIDALGRIGDRRATPSLIAVLQDSQAAVAACGALARIGDPGAFEPLLELIAHRDPAIRIAAVGALHAIGHPRMADVIVPLLDHQDPLARESAIRVAGYFGYPDARDAVFACCSDPVEAVRVMALEHLPYFDEVGALPVLAGALEAGTPKTRAAAVRSLARLDTEAATSLLSHALSDPDRWVRYFAARALGERADGGSLPELVSVAESDPSPPVRIAAIEALGTRGVEIAPEPLLRAAGEDNGDIACAALTALGRLGGADGLTALRGATRHSDPARRKAAASALGARATREAVEDLEWLAAADDDLAVAECAIRTLADVAAGPGQGAPYAVDSLVALLADSDRYGHVVAAIARLPVSMIPRVAEGLNHAHPVVRCRTVEALSRYRHPDATRRLAPAFEDEDPRVRETAAGVIERLGSRLFDETLSRLASDDGSKAVRRAASAAIAAQRSTT